MVVQLEEAVPVERWWTIDHLDDEGACFVPLRAGGPLTRIYCAADVPERETEWVWQDRVPIGHVTAIVGPRGTGKSYLVAEMAARLSKGDPWPDDPQTEGDVAETLIITAEEDIATDILPRLRACGADLSNVHVVDFRDTDGKSGTLTGEVIEEMADHLHGLKLIVIDPFAKLIGDGIERRVGDLKTLLDQLAAIAARRGVGIVLVNASDKVSAGKAPRCGVDVLPFLDASARAIWTVEEDPGQAGRLLWLPSRVNVGPGREGLAFRIDGAPRKVVWDPEPVALRADDFKPAAQRRMTKVAAAANWLQAFLATGSRPSADVREASALAGISRGSLYEAKSRLGILSVKETDTPNGSWSWRLVKEPPLSPEDSNVLMRFVAGLGKALHEQLAAEAIDAGSRTAPDGEGGVNDDAGATEPSPRAQAARGQDGSEYRDSPEDSNVLTPAAKARKEGLPGQMAGAESGLAPAPIHESEGKGGRRAIGRADLVAADLGAPGSEYGVLSEDSKVMV